MAQKSHRQHSRRMGRPPLPEDQRMKRRTVWFSDAQWALLRQDATTAGCSVAEWVRDSCGF